MKRGITAITILILCAAFAISVNFVLEHKAQLLYDFALTAVNDKNTCFTLEKEWSRSLIYFKLFSDHGRFESIDEGIKRLRYLEGEEYRKACRDTVTDLLEFKDQLAFSLPNIF